MRTNRWGRTVVGAATVVAVLALAACGDDDETVTTEPADTTATPGDDTDGLPQEPAQEELDERYVGRSLEEAQEAAEEAGVPWRVEREDGEDFALTMDYVPERVNFTVEDGTVTAVRAG